MNKLKKLINIYYSINEQDSYVFELTTVLVYKIFIV